MDITSVILGALVGVAAAAVVGVVIARALVRSKLDQAVGATETRLAAEKEGQERRLEEVETQARSADSRARNFERELKASKAELQKKDERLAKREEVVERKSEAVVAREAEVVRREKTVALKEKTLGDSAAEQERVTAEAKRVLERIAGMSQEEARKTMLDRLMDDVKLAAARQIKQVEEEAKEEA